ncbi:glucagon-1-like [Syngnathoides biaculeatus]|uniref:glucagon-1-like n=1 Tax=Syngnathoides biaculeatus TaxID=300417 RepID=UPI002ADD5699|nr:glucagon-1-like [Syngnathoides biaculeatus]
MTSIRSLAGLVVILSFVKISWQVPLQDISSLEADDDLVRRHLERMFANNYSKYLEDQKAQEFAPHLMNNKRRSAVEKRHSEGTYTSDVSSYLQDQVVKDFVTRLMLGQIRREWDAKMHDQTSNRRRHVDGSFTSDVNKVLDSMAAKEFLLWVMTSKSSGESQRRQAEH